MYLFISLLLRVYHIFLSLKIPFELFESTVFFIIYIFNTQVPDQILIDRCVGRRLDPETGKIYHINDFPTESEEIKARLVLRPDDIEDKVSKKIVLKCCFVF